jgi:hypothetical protein
MLILVAIWKAVTGFFSSVCKFLVEHPLVLGALVVFAVGMLAGGWLEGKQMESKYEPVIQAFQKDAQARELKIKQIEADTQQAAAEARTVIQAKDSLIDAVSKSYEERIAAMKKNPQIKTVIVPGAKETVYVNQAGEVSCRRFPQEFTDTVNEMVDKANGDVQKGKAP